jgi:hypothetical protein
VPADASGRITFLFEDGTVTVGGRGIPIAPFRFERVTKGNVYYASIDC